MLACKSLLFSLFACFLICNSLHGQTDSISEGDFVIPISSKVKLLKADGASLPANRIRLVPWKVSRISEQDVFFYQNQDESACPLDDVLPLDQALPYLERLITVSYTHLTLPTIYSV